LKKGLTENPRNVWIWGPYPRTLSAWSTGATVVAQPFWKKAWPKTLGNVWV